ncbi:hypothetical protein FQZ97_962040 [compost metagenome]
MREGSEALFRFANANLVQKLERACTCCLITHALMHFQNFADLPFHRMQWIERGHRLLKNHGDIIAAHTPQLRL